MTLPPLLCLRAYSSLYSSHISLWSNHTSCVIYLTGKSLFSIGEYLFYCYTRSILINLCGKLSFGNICAQTFYELRFVDAPNENERLGQIRWNLANFWNGNWNKCVPNFPKSKLLNWPHPQKEIWNYFNLYQVLIAFCGIIISSPTFSKALLTSSSSMHNRRIKLE